MKNFTSRKDVNDLQSLLHLANTIKQSPYSFQQLGKNKTLGLIFFNPSLRTRLSTQKAAQNLGMEVMIMNLDQNGWKIEMKDGTIMDQGSQEHINDAVAVISQYCDIIGVRAFAGLENALLDEQEMMLSK